jgi:hypothetical protein
VTTAPFPQQSATRDAYATPEDLQAGRVTGVGYAIPVKTGIPIAVYINETPAAPPVRADPAPAPVTQVIVQRPGLDPITTRIASASAGAAGVAAAVGHYAHELADFAHAAAGASLAVGVAAFGVAVLRGNTPKIDVHITNNNSNTGSTAHATASSNARSAAGWKNNVH